MKLNDAEFVFHLRESNNPMLVEEDQIAIGVQSREHNMNVSMVINMKKETKDKLMKDFIYLRNTLSKAIEKEPKNAEIQD